MRASPEVDGDEKLDNLYRIVEIAEKLHLPVVAGTEMNSPGQKLVDDFESDQLLPLAPVFLKGAHIVYAHSVLQRKSGLGYTSEWARKNFPEAANRNKFFEKLGSAVGPDQEEKLAGLEKSVSPEEILERIG